MLKKIAYLSLIFSSSVLAELPAPDPTSYPDVVLIPPPTLTIRNLNTGEPIRNGHYGERSDKNKHWRLLDSIMGGQPVVQFQALDTQQCLTQTGLTKSCSDTAVTSFKLVATDTGAFILQSPVDGACMFSNGFRQYGIAQCLRPAQLSKPIGLPFLWAVLPAFGKSQLLKVPTL